MGLWRWYRTAGGDQWLAGLYQESVENATPQFTKQMALLYDAEGGRLVECDPFYVSSEMTELIDVARADFVPEKLQEYDLLSPRGFLYYARPITIGDRHGIELDVRAFSWSQQYTFKGNGDETIDEAIERLGVEVPESKFSDRFRTIQMDALAVDGFLEPSGIMIALYSDTEPYIRKSAEAHQRASGGEAYERSLANMQRLTTGTPLVPIHIAPWPYDMTFDGNEVDIVGDPTGAMEWWKLAQTTFRLMLQRRPRVGYGRPDRAARREWERHGGRPDTEVVIVRLRREESPRREDSEHEEGEGRKFTHRFVRSGHWRNQWYPSIQQHRQIRIDPTIVGDESLPLIVRPRRVFQWQK